MLRKVKHLETIMNVRICCLLIGPIFILVCIVLGNQRSNALENTNYIIESRDDEIGPLKTEDEPSTRKASGEWKNSISDNEASTKIPIGAATQQEKSTTLSNWPTTSETEIKTSTYSPFEINGWQLGGFVAGLMTDPHPMKKICMKTVEDFLKKLRTNQRYAIEYWRDMSVKDEIKWSSLESLYDPSLIRFDLMYKYVSRDGNNKYFVGFANRSNDECKIVTLGVGFDYAVETRIANQYPYCTFIAVDPVTDINRELVQRVPRSRFYRGLIGPHDGNYTATLFVNDRYKSVNATHVGIVSFLGKFGTGEIIDLLNIDVGGSEFEILPTLIDEKERLPMICQINFELHFPPEQYGYSFDDAIDAIDKFLTDGTYSIFNVDVNRHVLHVFVVNTINSFCVRKFFC